jgi:methionyl-tRNA formyltransferase
MKSKANILLIGMGITAQSALESLAAEFNVVGIIRNLSVGEEETDPVAGRARDLKIPLFQDISPSVVETLVAQMQPDCVVVSSYNRILKAELLERCHFVNVHYSPLPRYRGRANVNWALINDEPCSAITIHLMSPSLDAGNILFQRLLPIEQQDTIGDLYHKLNEIQGEYLASTIKLFLGGYKGFPQEEFGATYCCTRLPEDGLIDWNRPTQQIDCFIRGLADPFPGAYTYLEGKKLTIWEAEPLKTPPEYIGRVPGRVVGRSVVDGYADVLTGNGVLRIFKVQLEDEAKVSATHVIRSLRSTLGLHKSELLARIELLEKQINRLNEAVNTKGG